MSVSDVLVLIVNQFHRGEYTVKQVKDFLQQEGLLVRQFESDI